MEADKMIQELNDLNEAFVRTKNEIDKFKKQQEAMKKENVFDRFITRISKVIFDYKEPIFRNC